MGNLRPNITFILKVKKNSFIKRLKKRKTRNRYDNFPSSFYLKAQKSFLKLLEIKRTILLDSSKNDSSLEKKIFDIVAKKLKH